MAHDPPDEFRYNKLREVGGSYQLTLVKTAVDAAEIDSSPPRPVFAHIPAARGAWVAFDVDRYAAQRHRVRVRTAVTDELAPETTVVGEFPVAIRGKLGSAVTRVPQRLAERAGLERPAQITTIALGPGAVLVATQARVEAAGDELAAAIEAARQRLDAPDH